MSYVLWVEFMRCSEPVADLSFQQTTFLLPRASLLARANYVQNIPAPSRLPSRVLCASSSPAGTVVERAALQPPHYPSHTEGSWGTAAAVAAWRGGMELRGSHKTCFSAREQAAPPQPQQIPSPEWHWLLRTNGEQRIQSCTCAKMGVFAFGVTVKITWRWTFSGWILRYCFTDDEILPGAPLTG